jgi:hypothetical protein
MIPVGMLTPSTVRNTYLRGITLGAAWAGSAGDMAIASLLALQISRAETLMGIHFHRYRIATLPDPTAVPGTDYDRQALPIPYTPVPPGMLYYPLTLHWHDVQAITRVRLFEGYDTQPIPMPITVTLPLTNVRFSSYQERLYVPTALVPPLAPVQGWAVDYLMGLGVLPPEVAEWCLLGSAIQVLGMAGSGADNSGGLGGETLRMDGIEESYRYGGAMSQQYGGLYGGVIRILQQQQDMIELSHLRFRYQNTLGDCTTIPPGAVLPMQPYEQTVCTPRLPVGVG